MRGWLPAGLAAIWLATALPGCLEPPKLDQVGFFFCATDADCVDWVCWAGPDSAPLEQPICVPEVQCSFLGDPACDDGLACTVDSCSAKLAQCEHTTAAGQCAMDGACGCSAMDDPDHCLVGVCEAGACVQRLAAPGMVCGDSECLGEGRWTGAVCDGETALCPAEAEAMCSEQSACIAAATGCEPFVRATPESVADRWVGPKWTPTHDGTRYDFSAWILHFGGSQAPIFKAQRWDSDGQVRADAPGGKLAEDGVLTYFPGTGSERVSGLFDVDQNVLPLTDSGTGSQALLVRAGEDPVTPQAGTWSGFVLEESSPLGWALYVKRESLELGAGVAALPCVTSATGLISEVQGSCLTPGPHGALDLDYQGGVWHLWTARGGRVMVGLEERPVGTRAGAVLWVRDGDDAPVGEGYVVTGVERLEPAAGQWRAHWSNEPSSIVETWGNTGPAACGVASTGRSLTSVGGRFVAQWRLEDKDHRLSGPALLSSTGGPTPFALLARQGDKVPPGIMFAVWRPQQAAADPGWCQF